ncbi:MAG: LAGLIDADG family homing endonuclease [Mycobacteriales bacterium]
MFRSNREAAGYLAGLIDGEGSVYARGYRRLIHVFNTEESIVQACLQACSQLGIEAQARVRENAAPGSKVPMWTISIYGRGNLERAARVLRLHSSRKQAALHAAVASYSRRRPVERSEFEVMLRDGLTHRQMAQKLGYKSHGTVQYHLRRLCILEPHRKHECRCRACIVGREGFEVMLARGMRRSEISRALGYRNANTITYHFRRLGVCG